MGVPGVSRGSLNSLKFALVWAVLVTAVAAIGANFDSDTYQVDDESEMAIDLEEPSYTDFLENFTSYSQATFETRGMGGLYSLTNGFIDLIMPKDLYPDDMITVVDGNLQLDSLKEQWKTLLSHYSALLVVVIVLLLIGILMPLSGLCFCLCRCCENCGARSTPLDKKGDCYCKICLSALLIAATGLLLFGVVGVFVTNEHMQDGTDDLPGSLKRMFNDTERYLSYTENQINVLLDQNYHEFESRVFKTLNDTGKIVMDQLKEYSNASVLTDLVNVVRGLRDINDNLTVISRTSEELRNNTKLLKDELQVIKTNLTSALDICNLSDCKDIKEKYVKELEGTFEVQLPDISNGTEELKNLLNSGLEDTLDKGQKALDDIQSEISSHVNGSLSQVKSSIEKAGDALDDGRSKITTVLDNTKELISNYTDKPVDDAEDYLKTYSPYRYYTELVVSCALLLILVCIILGLIFGIFGTRPDADNAGCCNKRVGSCFLITGVVLIFSLSIFFAIITIAHLLVGVLGQRVVCDSLREPNNSQLIRLADEMLDLKATVGVDVNISSVLMDCYDNQSIYKVFKLESKFNLDEVNDYVEKFNINETLEELVNKIDANINITILSGDAEKDLNELAAAEIGKIEYDKFINASAQNFTSTSLSDLADIVRNLNNDIEQVQGSRDDNLDKCEERLRVCQEDYVEPMIAAAEEMSNAAKNVKEGLKFGKESFETGIKDFIASLKATEEYLNNNANETLRKVAWEFGSKMEAQVLSYLNRVIDNAKDNVGQCGPARVVLDAMLVASCDKILMPLNGFWLSILVSLLVFIPTVFISVMLDFNYRKFAKSQKPLVEQNTRDRFFHNDHRKERKHYEWGDTYYREASNKYSAHRDLHYENSRYADMAPKFSGQRLGATKF